MRGKIWLLAFAVFATLCRAGVPDPPQRLFGPLYAAVEEAGIFADSKEFADAVPKSPPATIMDDYRRLHPQTPADLKAFVAAHFTLPQNAEVPAATIVRRPLARHIDALWPHLVRRTPTAPAYSSLLPLPYPYVVPGGRFRELYYWDSYFTMLGLTENGRQNLVRDMVRNFAHFIDRYGHIPNGSRSYYLSRSQPPFFFLMVALTEPDDPAKAYQAYLPQLKAEYRYWMAGSEGLKPGEAKAHVVALAGGTVLNRYWDASDTPRDESYREDVLLARHAGRPPAEVYRDLRAAAESGWDFSARWFADGKSLSTIVTTEIVPVDLNSLLFGLEDAIRQGCARQGDAPCARDFAAAADRRRAAINHFLWNGRIFTDYRWTERRQTGVFSAASFYPLFFGIARADQAKSVAATARTELLKPGGLAATTINTGQQWDAPNGWAPLQWMAVEGLHRYRNDLSRTIACRWLAKVSGVYRRTGKLVEKYDVENTDKPGGGGEYPTQDGFGWTNGVTAKLMVLYPAAAKRPGMCAASP